MVKRCGSDFAVVQQTALDFHSGQIFKSRIELQIGPERRANKPASISLPRTIRACSELPLSADSVEKHRVSGAEIIALNGARAPFLSGFARLLRCRKDLG